MIFRFRFQQAGGHTHVSLFAGLSEGALGKCGNFVMRNEEWEVFQNQIDAVSYPTKPIELQFIDEKDSSVTTHR